MPWRNCQGFIFYTMDNLKYVTESDIPSVEAFLMVDRFVLVNMGHGGIWLVDKQHPQWEKIKEVAIATAKLFGTPEHVEKAKAL